MIILVLFSKVSKSQCIDASCHHALCCVIIMNGSHNTYLFYKYMWNFFQNHMDKRLSWIFGFMVVVR